jgi:hypothetical protein
MKKIILAVIISIIGITASAQTNDSYSALYELHRDRIYNYCNSDDLKFVRQWYTRTYHPSVLNSLNTQGQTKKLTDLLVLNNIWDYTVEEAVYFFVAMKCAYNDERVTVVAFNLLEECVIEKLKK